MKTFSRFGMFALSVGVVVTGASGCGSDTHNGGSSASSAGTGGAGGPGGSGPGGEGGGAAALGIQPPPPGPNTPPDGAGPAVFAIRKLYLGDTKPDGSPDLGNGWKLYGFDLDSKISTAQSMDLCKPRDDMAPKNVYPDGELGRDNGFGKNILSIILGIAPDAPQKVNENIQSGRHTLLFDLENLGMGASYSPLTVRFYEGANLGAAPKFDGSDQWPVKPESLTGNDIASPKLVFTQSYVVGNTWVGRTEGPLPVRLATDTGFLPTLQVFHAIVTMNLTPDHKAASGGTIAGILSTDQLEEGIRQTAGAFDPSLCSGPTIDSITTQLRQASDILKSGEQDPSKECDGISIGLGFDAARVELGAIAPPEPPTPDPCP